jgi:phosphate transport system substrate-binding protein
MRSFPCRICLAPLAAVASLAAAGSSRAAAAAAPLRASGAAATQPLWQRFFSDYAKAHPDFAGSFATAPAAEAARAVAAGTASFAGATSSLSDAQLAATPALAALPVAVGAVAVVYNVLIAGDLKLTPQLVADIFAGRVARWRDPALAAANPGVVFPDLRISVVVQADETGDAATFREYLAHVGAPAAAWAGKVAADPRALIEVFVQPSMRSIGHAAVGVRLRDDFRASIVDARGVEAYPIARFSFAVIDGAAQGAVQRRALFEFLRYVVHEGQLVTPALGYAPLPGLLARTVDARLQQLDAQKHAP